MTAPLPFATTPRTTPQERAVLAQALSALQVVALVPAALALVLPVVRYRPLQDVDGEQPLAVLRAIGATDGPARVALALLLVELLVLAGVAASAILSPDGDRGRAVVTWVTSAAMLVTLLALDPVLTLADRTDEDSYLPDVATFAVHAQAVVTALLTPALLLLVQARVAATRSP